MELYAQAIDLSARLGDTATAMRYLWADVVSQQSQLDSSDMAHFVRPDVFSAQRSGRAVLLKRTFDQSDFKGGMIRYWRVMSEWHPRYMSDLSQLGLQEAAII